MTRTTTYVPMRVRQILEANAHAFVVLLPGGRTLTVPRFRVCWPCWPEDFAAGQRDVVMRVTAWFARRAGL